VRVVVGVVVVGVVVVGPVVVVARGDDDVARVSARAVGCVDWKF